MKKLRLFIAILLVANIVKAQDTTKVINLNEVEITASSILNKTMLNQPVSIVKLGATELKRGTGLTLDDAINANIPGVFMQRRTVGAGQSFNIRGYGNGARGTNGVNSNFDGQGSKVYLNNILITDAEGITLMDDIDFGSIGNVEVVKGPAGSLYGLAIAGVINLGSMKPEKGKSSIGQEVLLGTYGLSRYTTHVAISNANSSVLINYGKQKYDGFAPHTASHKDFVTVLGDFTVSNRQSISTYLGYSNSYDERNGELTIDQYTKFDYSGNPNYIANNAHTNVISFRGGLSHNYKFNEHFSNSTAVFGSGISSNVSSAGGWTDKLPVNYGIRSTFNAKFNINDKMSLSGITGIESQQQNAQILGYPMVKDSFNLTGYNIVGALRSNQYTISKTTSLFTEWTLALPSDFSITAGIGSSSMGIELNDRFYNLANNNPAKNPRITPPQYKKSYDGMVSPHLAINKVFNKQISIYAAYSKGYKAPVSSYFFIPVTGALNTNLKPEIGNQYEVGTKGSLFGEKLNFQIAAFNAIFSDKMTVVAVPNAAATATSYTYVANGGTQNNKGLEVLVKYTTYQSSTGFISAVKPFANLAYSNFKYENFKYQQLNSAKTDKTEVDFSGKTVVGVPPLTANVGLDVLANCGLYANLTLMHRDAMYFTSDNVNKTAATDVLNGKIGFQKTLAEHWGLDLYAGAINLTSTQYYQMVFSNQLPDAYLPAPNKANYFGGVGVKYIF